MLDIDSYTCGVTGSVTESNLRQFADKKVTAVECKPENLRGQRSGQRRFSALVPQLTFNHGD